MVRDGPVNWRYCLSMQTEEMPQPGDPCPGFVVEPGRCWQIVYDRNLQAAHCPEWPA